MKLWKASVAAIAVVATVAATADTDAQTRSRAGRSKPTATQKVASEARPWGILAILAGSSWLQDTTGAVTLYKWKLRNEILEIQTHSKDDTEPRIDEIRLTADGSTITRVTVAPKGQIRRFAIEMPRPGILIEAEALGATVTRRTSRLANDRMFSDTQTTLNGRITATDTAEWRKAGAAEIASAINSVAAAQGAKRLARAAMEREWGPLASLVDNDWQYSIGGATFLTQYRWRDPGKVMVASHTASRKSLSYEEIIALDAATGTITGRANGLAVSYTLEDGAMVATPAGGKSRTLRKPAGPAGHQIVTQKRKGEHWVTVENIIAENANGGIATTPVELASTREASVILAPARIPVSLPAERRANASQQQSSPPPASGAATKLPAGTTPRQQAQRPTEAVPPPEPTPLRTGNGGLFGKLMGAAGGALAMGSGGGLGDMMQGAIQGAAMVDGNGNLVPGAAQALSGGAGGLDIAGALMRGGGRNAAAAGLLGSLAGGGAVARSTTDDPRAAVPATSTQTVNGAARYPTKPNLALRFCPGFTEANYRSLSTARGPDTQRKTHCGLSFEYYTMYKRAIAQGYSEADSNRTYAAHEGAVSSLRSLVE